MLFKWIDQASRKITNLTGLSGERGEFAGIVISFILFYIAAWLFVTGVAFVTGISTGALWSLVMVGCLVHFGWQHMKR